MNDQIFNINFVGEVEKYPCLYNYVLPEYSRKDLTEKAWNEVGKIVKLTGVYVEYFLFEKKNVQVHFNNNISIAMEVMLVV